jgi:hypothetical protein
VCGGGGDLLHLLPFEGGVWVCYCVVTPTALFYASVFRFLCLDFPSGFAFGLPVLVLVVRVRRRFSRLVRVLRCVVLLLDLRRRRRRRPPRIHPRYR